MIHNNTNNPDPIIRAVAAHHPELLSEAMGLTDSLKCEKRASYESEEGYRTMGSVRGGAHVSGTGTTPHESMAAFITAGRESLTDLAAMKRKIESLGWTLQGMKRWPARYAEMQRLIEAMEADAATMIGGAS